MIFVRSNFRNNFYRGKKKRRKTKIAFTEYMHGVKCCLTIYTRCSCKIPVPFFFSFSSFFFGGGTLSKTVSETLSPSLAAKRNFDRWFRSDRWHILAYPLPRSIEAFSFLFLSFLLFSFPFFCHSSNTSRRCLSKKSVRRGGKRDECYYPSPFSSFSIFLYTFHSSLQPFSKVKGTTTFFYATYFTTLHIYII